MKNLFLKPRLLLLVDAVGAVVTSVVTISLLAGQQIKVGLPVELLYGLAAVAACFACFDIVAINRRIDPVTSLRIIACANITYCMFVMVSLYMYRNSVTRIGIAYFCIEISIVVSLAVWEWIVAARTHSSDRLR